MRRKMIATPESGIILPLKGEENLSHKSKTGLLFEGGGVTNATTFGMLKPTLHKLDQQCDIKCISGGSGGAVQAVLTALGLNIAGPEYAIRLLEKFWKDMEDHGFAFSPFQKRFRGLDPFWYSNNRDHWPNIPLQVLQTIRLSQQFNKSGLGFGMNSLMTQLTQPFNENSGLGFSMHYLRNLIDRHVGGKPGWDIIRNGRIKLFINASELDKTTGRYHNVVFEGNDIDADAVAASAALEIFGPHKKNGKEYFDCVYSGANPDVSRIRQEQLDHLVAFTVSASKKGMSNGQYKGKMPTVEIHDELAELWDKPDRPRLHNIGFTPLSHWNESSCINLDPDLVKYLIREGTEIGNDWLRDGFDKMVKGQDSYSPPSPAQSPAKSKNDYIDPRAA